MYSFANRPDSFVVDEPMYAYYLWHSGANHPGKEEIIASLPVDLNEIKKDILFKPLGQAVFFIKGMAHHYLDSDLAFLSSMKNVLLIRDPKSLIRSFSKVIALPTLRDIGLKREYEIMSFLKEQKLPYTVLDAHEVLKNPERVLRKLCERLHISFYPSMLMWPRGPRKEDGVWAKYWYGSVHKSTGFGPPSTEEFSLEDRYTDLYQESMPYYLALYEQALKA